MYTISLSMLCFHFHLLLRICFIFFLICLWPFYYSETCDSNSMLCLLDAQCHFSQIFSVHFQEHDLPIHKSGVQKTHIIGFWITCDFISSNVCFIKVMHLCSVDICLILFLNQYEVSLSLNSFNLKFTLLDIRNVMLISFAQDTF